VERGEGITNAVSFLAGVAALLSVPMIVVCTRRSMKEYAGLDKSLITFAVSFGIVPIYYGILVARFWHMFPIAAAST
jgi:hypothetical protein